MDERNLNVLLIMGKTSLNNSISEAHNKKESKNKEGGLRKEIPRYYLPKLFTFQKKKKH